MNIARIGLLVVAIGAAGAAAILVRMLAHKPAHERSANGSISAEVLVASRELQPGAVMKPGDLRWQSWPKESLSPSFMTKKALPKALDTAIGSTLRAHLDQGEPVTGNKLVKADGAGFMAAMLTPGMRAVSTKIDENTAAGGFILPGDRVDVVMTRRADRKSGASANQYESQTVLADVRVLAIGQTVEGSTSADKTAPGKTATLELTPPQAEMLALANAMGKLTLVLRSAAKADGVTASTEPAPEMLGRAGEGNGEVTVVRYGYETRVTPEKSNSSGDGQ